MGMEIVKDTRHYHVERRTGDCDGRTIVYYVKVRTNGLRQVLNDEQLAKLGIKAGA